MSRVLLDTSWTWSILLCCASGMSLQQGSQIARCGCIQGSRPSHRALHRTIHDACDRVLLLCTLLSWMLLDSIISPSHITLKHPVQHCLSKPAVLRRPWMKRVSWTFKARYAPSPSACVPGITDDKSSCNSHDMLLQVHRYSPVPWKQRQQPRQRCWA